MIGNERKRKRTAAQALSRNRSEKRLRIAYRKVSPNTENYFCIELIDLLRLLFVLGCICYFTGMPIASRF